MTSEAMKYAHVHKAVFLDRDGTLIEDRGHEFCSASEAVLRRLA